MIRLICTILLAVVLCASLPGCKGKTDADHPQGEHPKSEEATSEHPKGEHPQSEDSTSEHPKGEHPE